MSLTQTRSPVTNAPEMTMEFAEHLFIANDSNRMNDQHQGKLVVSDATKLEWLSLLDGRATLMREAGIPYVFVLAPDKQTVYRHLLPETYKFRQADFLMALPYVLDPAEVLSAVAKQTDVFPKTDSHWNHLGSFLTVQLVKERLAYGGEEPKHEWFRPEKNGDLGDKFAPARSSQFLMTRTKSRSHMIYDNLIPNNGRVRIFSKENLASSTSASSLLLFGDSYSYNLIHFFREIFDVVCHVHSFSIDYSLIDFMKPAFIVNEVAERFVIRPPAIPDVDPLTAMWKEKVAIGAKLEPVMGLHQNDDCPLFTQAVALRGYVEELFCPFRDKFLNA